MENLLELRDIVKTFGGTRALRHVTVTVRPGEVHAIVGENGAGKSTLMKILCGVYKADQGTVILDGHAVHFHNPLDAMRMGIATVHQQFTLVPELTVAENIFLGRLPRGAAGLVDWDRLYRDAEAVLQRVDFALDVRRPVRVYGAAGRQVTEIARALSLDAKILILDEPTAVLGPSEVDKLFTIIRGLQAQGVTILYISHRLAEIFADCRPRHRPQGRPTRRHLRRRRPDRPRFPRLPDGRPRVERPLPGARRRRRRRKCCGSRD